MLAKSSQFTSPKGPVVLLILDGVGNGSEGPENAVYCAKTPCLDTLKTQPTYRELKAHGKAVGMPTDADMGNSEVGHNALGAGRVFDQGAALVINAISDGSMFQSTAWQELAERGQKGKTLHLIGLLSDGNVHAHIAHFEAVITQAKSLGIQKLRCHILLDGRDVSPRSALGYITQLESYLETDSTKMDYQIASGGGRMLVTMDRYDADWEMVQCGWDLHVHGKGPQVESAKAAVEAAYSDPEMIDQYIPGFVIAKEGEPVGKIQDGDGVLFMNFRGDRAIELSKAFELDHVPEIERGVRPDVFFAGMLEYDGDLKLPAHHLVMPPKIDRPVSTYLCELGVRTFAISETQKYGHVTFFWNGNRSGYVDESLETYCEIPSDPRPFHEQPAMRAPEITEKTIEAITSGEYEFIRVNFPNGDMIGHTGVLDAVISSMEIVDSCVQKLIDVITENQGVAIILADHGNADVMFKLKDGEKVPVTSHTLNPVPFCIMGRNYTLAELPEAGLANVAATICNLLGYEAPEDYEPSLIGSQLT